MGVREDPFYIHLEPDPIKVLNDKKNAQKQVHPLSSNFVFSPSFLLCKPLHSSRFSLLPTALHALPEFLGRAHTHMCINTYTRVYVTLLHYYIMTHIYTHMHTT